MTAASAVLFRRLTRRLAIDVEVGKPEEDDLAAVFEAHFDERVVTVARHDRVHAPGASDPCAVGIGEICAIVAVRAHGDRSADKDA